METTSTTITGPEVENIELAEYVEQLRETVPINNRVLLIQVPQFLFDSFDPAVARQRATYAWPPTGLQCIKSTLSDRDLDIHIYDLNFALLKRLVEDESFDFNDWPLLLNEELERVDPSIVGVTGISVSADASSSLFPFTAVLRHLQKAGRYVVIGGGTTATNELDYYLKNELCHFVLTGEGENKINYLFDHIYGLGPQTPAKKGLYFKSNGVVAEVAGEPDTVSLSGNIIPTYIDLPIEEYSQAGSLNPFSRMAGQDTPYATFQLNRGCRANCMFCGVPDYMGAGVRQIPAEETLTELTYLVKERGIRHFEVLDDDFLGPPRLRDSVAHLLRGMGELRQEYGITWAAGNGLIASSVTDDILRLAQDSGCLGFRIGIESGNAAMLKHMRKPASLKIIRRVSDEIQNYPEIFVGGNYIIGLFGTETFGQMMDTFRLSCEIKLDWASYSTFQFTSKATAEAEGLATDDTPATEFVPSKDAYRQEEGGGPEVSGPAIFGISQNEIPSREQIKHIWFAFNLISNYIFNKNLMPGGNPGKLVSWLEAVRVAYPGNPYMLLFLALGYVLLGQKERAGQRLGQSKAILDASQDWAERFEEFGLGELISRFPVGEREVFSRVETLRNQFLERM
jgi:hypothetical protein